MPSPFSGPAKGPLNDGNHCPRPGIRAGLARHRVPRFSPGLLSGLLSGLSVAALLALAGAAPALSHGLPAGPIVATPAAADTAAGAPEAPEGDDSDATANTTMPAGLAGAYLAARQAADESDFTNAAKWFLVALEKDPHDAFLIDSALVSLISAGQTDRAATLAAQLAERGDATELAGLVNRATAARDGDWDGLIALIDKGSPDQGGSAANDLLDGMLRAWAELGSGRASEAMAQMQRLARIPGARQMIDFDLALVKASVGDYEGAEALLSKPGVGTHLLGTIAQAEVLAQLDRRDEALSLIASHPGAAEEPGLIDLSARLTSGQPVPFTGLQGATDGVAQTFLTFAGALSSGADPDPLALVQARLAEWLRPELADARLIAAQLLQSVGQFDLAEEEYEALGKMRAVRPVAELARIDALARADRLEDAEKAAKALTEARPELTSSWFALGDIMRQREEYAESVPVYTRGIELIDGADDEARWFPLYARGIARERSGDFKSAEADMRAALKIRPNQASILNYLGYTFIDRGINLDEGLAMVEKAAELQPDDGYIQDSLGWGLYRVGRYQEAVAPMEKAATRMSGDPLVNDHLGDVYWKVGREREAEVQWRRALSLVLDTNINDTDEEVDLERLREKIEFGMDPRPAGSPLDPAAGADAGTGADAIFDEAAPPARPGLQPNGSESTPPEAASPDAH